MSHAAWPEESTRAMLLSEFDERFRRYRLSVPEAERALVDSLKRYGQMAPVVVCVTPEQRHEIIHRFHSGQSMRGIGKDLQLSPQTVSRALRQHAADRREGPLSADSPVPPDSDRWPVVRGGLRRRARSNVRLITWRKACWLVANSAHWNTSGGSAGGEDHAHRIDHLRPRLF